MLFPAGRKIACSKLIDFFKLCKTVINVDKKTVFDKVIIVQIFSFLKDIFDKIDIIYIISIG